ncbi:hypothetical protein [Marinobacter sp.]|uniref:hypothetical protein n=1 Tax=Marinobacter sp. TaxID=50741 RepID=UPI003565326E
MEKPDVSGFSDSGLQKMHLAVLHSLEKDDATPEGKPKVYGVREYNDWRAWADALEEEMDKRGVTHNKVPW